MSKQFGSVECRPLSETFGASAHGVDFTKPLPQDVVDDLVRAHNYYGVLVFYNTGLNDQTHCAFSKQLGELEKSPKFTGPDQPDRFSEPYLFDAGNTLIDGTLVQKDSRRWHYNKGNALWHVDSSFNQRRSKYSLLLSHKVPKAGGDTGFADVRTAYNDLPQEKKDQIEDLVVEHNLWHSRKVAAPEEFASITETEMAVKPPAYHRLVQTGPDGRKTLYVAAHAKRILGWPDDKGLALINELLDWCSQPKYTMTVKWEQQVGQLVWWSNITTMHRATPFSDQMEVRDMRRTTVFDDSPDANGVPNAHERELRGQLPAA